MADLSLERAMTSVGLSNFVEFYEDYWAHDQKDENLREVDKKRLAQKLFDLNPKATSHGAQRRFVGATPTGNFLHTHAEKRLVCGALCRASASQCH